VPEAHPVMRVEQEAIGGALTHDRRLSAGRSGLQSTLVVGPARWRGAGLPDDHRAGMEWFARKSPVGSYSALMAWRRR
jgi:hypothetical protein